MNDYYEVRIDIDPCCEDATDYLAYMLAEIDYESFVPDDKGLYAYVQAPKFNEELLNEIFQSFPFGAKHNVSSKFIEGRDWNEEWERNFYKPIVIGDEVVVHSTFHTDVPQAKYMIAIDPKMAFGTGHHATTTQMIKRQLEEDVYGKYVVDMGTGTGILAILAAMRGASKVTAVEIDEFAWTNAGENLQCNGCDNIVDLLLGDVAKLDGIEDVDLFMANINRNIIINDLKAYAKTLRPGATMLLSGFYNEDVPLVREEAEKCGMQYVDHTTDNNWACVKLTKKQS